MTTRKILVVCTANRCRSVIAEAFLRRELANKPKFTDWEICSAGTRFEDGYPADRPTIEEMDKYGIDVRGHVSQRLTNDHLVDADIILTMTRRQFDLILRRYPQVNGQILLIRELVGDMNDISDPTQNRGESYGAVTDEIKNVVMQGMPQLVALMESV